jgi:hypothetical protein
MFSSSTAESSFAPLIGGKTLDLAESGTTNSWGDVFLVLSP